MLKNFLKFKEELAGRSGSVQKIKTKDTEVGKENNTKQNISNSSNGLLKKQYQQVKSSPHTVSRSGQDSPLSLSASGGTPLVEGGTPLSQSRSVASTEAKKKSAWVEMKEIIAASPPSAVSSLGSSSAPSSPTSPPTFFSSSFHHQTTLSVYQLKATTSGDPLSQARVGYCYEYNRGTSGVDYKEAFKWYKLSSDQNHAEGQVGLGNLLLKGIGGIPKDEKEGISLIEKSVAQGNTRAQGRLGLIYLKGLGGNPPDMKKGIELYKLAAEQGDVEAQYNLGICYENGTGVKKDEKEAANWYKQAAEQGFAHAQYNLAVYYDKNNPLNVDKDQKFDDSTDDRRRSGSESPKEAEDPCYWYRLAAFQGLKEAQYALGLCYQSGKGRIRRDKKEALRWFQLASEQGLEKARKHYNLIRGSAKKK